MEMSVEIEGWEHECCGPAFERNDLVELECLVIPDGEDQSARLVETHHGLQVEFERVMVRGRVVDIAVRRADGSTELVQRLPSGAALRGFDQHDDGRLEQPWTGESVTLTTGDFVLTISTGSAPSPTLPE